MTPLQQRIMVFIQKHIEKNGFSPSLAEIAQGIGISPKSVSLISRNIHSLVATGQLNFDKKGYRNITLANTPQRLLPLLGRIAAGTPIEAIENKEFINLETLLPHENHFALEVKGDSMIEEGILEGDIVICKVANTAREGEIVSALIDQHEATLKRISFRIPDRITLIPANSTLKPKAYLPQHVQIQGVFIGLVRLKN